MYTIKIYLEFGVIYSYLELGTILLCYVDRDFEYPEFKWLNSFFNSSVQLFSHVWLFAAPWTAGCQASLYITDSWSLLKLMSMELVMPSNHLIFCCPLLLPPAIFPSIGVFSSESISSDGPVLQHHVTAQFYLESKGKYILEAWGWADPKNAKRSSLAQF